MLKKNLKLGMFALFLAFAFLLISCSNNAFSTKTESNESRDNIDLLAKPSFVSQQQTEGLSWMSWEEAVEAQKKEPRKIVVDLYTDWCGWCKVMDKKTFTDKKIASYMDEKFYAVKLNAEQKEDIEWEGTTFEWKAGGRNGIHMLAYSLMNGSSGYPTLVYLNEKFERILISPGYKTPDQLITELEFTANERYKDSSWEDYKTQYQPKGK